MFEPNEQVNAIADYASLTLNNFVSSVGRSYINDSEIADIQAKADRCQVQVDLRPEAWKHDQRPKPLLETLKAFDDATEIDRVSVETLMKLPLWDNFQRWQNLVSIGLLYTSDVSNVDPQANAKVKELIDTCQGLYQSA